MGAAYVVNDGHLQARSAAVCCEPASNELTNVHLEEVGEDANARAQQKRSDAWAVSWDARCLLIEFTRLHDRCDHSQQMHRRLRYTPLLDRLSLLPAWELRNMNMRIHWSYIPDRWSADLNRPGLRGTSDRDLLSRAMKKITDLYSVCYAAIRLKKQGQNVEHAFARGLIQQPP
jgi:hypothetical protein